MVTKILIPLIIFFIFLASPSLAYAASLNLSPVNGTFNKGCSFTVDINLNTAGENTDGTDVILKFPATQVSVDSIVEGSIYPDYPAKTFDNSGGTISISGLASVSQPFNGSGKFATLNFSVKQTAVAGPAALTFDFDPANPAKTTDSNVVKTADVIDVLTSVTNGNYTVGTGTCGSTVVTSTPLPRGGGISATPSSSSITTLPPSGVSGPTLILVIIGGFLTILGIAGLALL